MFRRLILLIVACTVSFPLHADPLSFRALEKRWESARKKLHLPGASIAVVKDGAIVYEKGFGLADIEHAKPFTANTSSYLASVTKVFVTCAIMQLSDAGKVNIDAPVKAYLPRFQLSDAALTDRITLRDLLCHRYGLSNWPITFAEAYTGVFDEDFYYRELAKSEIKGKWSYNNLHFTLLGRVVEAVTGMPWQTYLQAQVFGPANMRGTTARASELYAFADCATPYAEENRTWIASPLRKVDSTMHAAGGIGSSAHDLSRFILVHLNGGTVDNTRLLSEASLREILTANVEPNERYGGFGRKEMGLGWYLGDYKGDLLVHHFGGYAGAQAHLSFMPQHNIGVAVITHSNEDISALIHYMAADAYDALLGRKPSDELNVFVKKSLRSQEAKSESTKSKANKTTLTLTKPLDAYVGLYTSEIWGPLQVSANANGLSGNIGNFQLTFTQNPDGDLVAKTPNGNGKALFHKGAQGDIDNLRIEMRTNWTMDFKR